MAILFFFISNSLDIQQQNKNKEIEKIFHKIRMKQKSSMQIESIIESLEEGIILLDGTEILY